MILENWLEEPIGKHHDRQGFDCGDAALNDYLRQHARRNHERGGSKTFVAIDAAIEGKVLGFYTLNPASVEFARTPAVIRQGLGRYDVAGFRLGRLAVSVDVQRQGLGGQLLLAAVRRCIRVSADVGGTVLIIDAKNERVASWYESYGAVAFEEDPLKLFLQLSIVLATLEAAGRL